MSNKKLRKSAILIMMSIILAFTMFATTALAEADDSDAPEPGKCTSIYFGPGMTENGSYLWGRTEDYSYVWRKILYVVDAETHAPGDLFKSNETSSTFTWPYPEKTLRYFMTPDSYYNENNSPSPYGEIGMNEAGVTITATVTLSNMKTAVNTASGDRMVSNGLEEIDTVHLVLMQAKTAREGVELLARIIDAKGATGREGTMIGDPNEIWYFQIFSGHQYVGVKCPDNMFGYSPNMTANVGFAGFGGYNGYLDVTDTENVIASPGLISMAQKVGSFVGDPADPDPTNPTRIKVADSYASSATSFKTGRLRLGYGWLYGLTTNAQVTADPRLPSSAYLNYFIDPLPNAKYSLYDAMRLLAYRGEGTDWVNAGPGNGSAIGNENTQEAHMIETRPGMPAELATVTWIAMGPAENSIYLPFYGNLLTDVYNKYYFSDHQSFITGDIYQNNFWHVFRALHNLCIRGTVTSGNNYSPTDANRAKYGQGVNAFWKKYQLSLIEQQTVVDKALKKILADKGRKYTEKLVTDFSIEMQKDAYEYAVTMVQELRAFASAGAVGNYVPSLLDDPKAAPRFAEFVKILDYAVPSVSIEKLDGNSSNLTVTVKEYYYDDSIEVLSKTFTVGNNHTGIFKVGDHSVYVEVNDASITAVHAANISLTKADGKVTVDYAIGNYAGNDIKVQCIISIYDTAGRMFNHEILEVPIAADMVKKETLALNLPEGYEARAFVWKMTSSVPLCDVARVVG